VKVSNKKKIKINIYPFLGILTFCIEAVAIIIACSILIPIAREREMAIKIIEMRIGISRPCKMPLLSEANQKINSKIIILSSDL